MTQSQYTPKAGTTTTERSEKGLKFSGFNHERNQVINFGTLSGVVYEKGNVSIFRNFNSINLPESEYGAVIDAGAQFLRCIPKDKSGTYSISFADFNRLKFHYHDPRYGPQWCVRLEHFAFSGTVTKRNAALDNPPIAREADPVKEKQLTLLGWMK